MAAPAYVASNTEAANSTTSTFLVPAGGQAGDLLLVYLTGPLSGPLMQSAGWTQYPSPPWSDDLFIWWKPWNGDTSFTLTDLANCHVSCFIYRGARTTGTPFAAATHLPPSTTAGGTSGTSRELPSVTVETGNCLLVGYAAPNKLTGASGSVEGMAVREQALYQNANNIVTSRISHVIADEGAAAAIGPSGTRTVTIDSQSSSTTWGLTSLVLLPKNSPPNAAAWVTPQDAAIPADQNYTLDWDFSDIDTGDTQSAYDLSRWALGANGARVGAATTIHAQTPNTQHLLVAGTLTAGTDYEFQVTTYDAQGEAGPASPSLFVTAATTPDGPTFTDPTAGQTINSASHTATISVQNADVTEWTLYADNAGSISATVLQGPVAVTSGDLRSHTFSGLVNNATIWWSARVKFQGLWSASAQVRTPVSFTPPPTPALVVAGDSASGIVTVAITNPAPSGDEPPVAFNNVFVRSPSSAPNADKYRPYDDTGTQVAKNKPAGSTFIDWAPADGVAYQYRVEAVADNGTVSYSPWASVDPVAEPTIYYGGGY